MTCSPKKKKSNKIECKLCDVGRSWSSRFHHRLDSANELVVLVAAVVYTTGSRTWLSSLHVNATNTDSKPPKVCLCVLISRVELISLCLSSTPCHGTTCHSRDPDGATADTHHGVILGGTLYFGLKKKKKNHVFNERLYQTTTKKGLG